MTLEFTEFVRKPFVVEAVEVTTENIEEIAKHVGDLREKDDGTPFIFVDRRLIPSIYRVYPGFYMTRMGDHIRCYSPKIFHEQFIAMTLDVAELVHGLNGDVFSFSKEMAEFNDSEPSDDNEIELIYHLKALREQGFSFPEIAEKRDLPVETVRSMLEHPSSHEEESKTGLFAVPNPETVIDLQFDTSEEG